MTRKIMCVAMVVLALSAVSTAQAGLITWGTAQNITGDSDVSLQGTLDHAYGGASAATVNGVSFTNSFVLSGWAPGTNLATAGSDTFHFNDNSANINKSGAHYGSASSPFASLSSSYQTLLRYGVYGDYAATTTYTLGGLTDGQPYLVQLWVNDSRGLAVGRTQILDGTTTMAYNAGAAEGSTGQYVTGTFTAAGTSQSFTILGNVCQQINAIQLRAIPEPSTLALLATGLIGLLCYAWRKRK